MSQQIIDVNPDEAQVRIVLPPTFIKQYPVKFIAEFDEMPDGSLRVRIVNPKTEQLSKRYRVVHHHRSTMLSLPRFWLRDRLAAQGDILDVVDQGLCVIVTLQKP